MKKAYLHYRIISIALLLFFLFVGWTWAQSSKYDSQFATELNHSKKKAAGHGSRESIEESKENPCKELIEKPKGMKEINGKEEYRPESELSRSNKINSKGKKPTRASRLAKKSQPSKTSDSFDEGEKRPGQEFSYRNNNNMEPNKDRDSDFGDGTKTYSNVQNLGAIGRSLDMGIGIENYLDSKKGLDPEDYEEETDSEDLMEALKKLKRKKGLPKAERKPMFDERE